MRDGKKFVSFAEHNPELVSEWHPTMNEVLKPTEVSYGSARKVWWICKKGHIWEASLTDRSRGRGCPICAKENRGVSHSVNWIKKNGSLAVKNPNLVKEWHPTKNNDLTPYDVAPNSVEKVWWQCEKGHEWEAVISSRNQGIG